MEMDDHDVIKRMWFKPHSFYFSFRSSCCYTISESITDNCFSFSKLQCTSLVPFALQIQCTRIIEKRPVFHIFWKCDNNTYKNNNTKIEWKGTKERRVNQSSIQLPLFFIADLCPWQTIRYLIKCVVFNGPPRVSQEIVTEIEAKWQRKSVALSNNESDGVPYRWRPGGWCPIPTLHESHYPTVHRMLSLPTQQFILWKKSIKFQQRQSYIALI